MAVRAKLNYLRIAPRKIRLVADLIRGKKVEEAQTILSFTTKKAADSLLKLLKSAIANAKHDFQLEEANLFISNILVDEGPKYKRWRARAKGVAYEIQKKTSHITLVLDEITQKIPRIKKIKKLKKPSVSKLEPKIGKTQKEGEIPTGRPKFKPELETKKPIIEKGVKRIFRRKAF